MPLDIPGKLVAPEPAPPVRQFSFTDWQVNNPTAPPPGDRLDAEFDRANSAISDTIDWAGTSLNTDGTLRSGIVGEPQLVPGLFDHIADDAVAEVQPLVAQAQTAATQAVGSATTAQGAANTASGLAVQAQNAATAAANSQTAASGSASVALDKSNLAQAAAISALDSANHADGSEAICQDYADVSMAWAEHMPDTIPPNILAVMGITGDHWSSRWWANHAASSVSDGLSLVNAAGAYWLGLLQDQTGDALQGIQGFYLGAFVAPPYADSFGNPVATGAMYFDLSLDAAYVWNGTAWRPLVTPAPPAITHYIYVATAGQTVFTGPDRAGNPLLWDPANLQTLDVFRKGLLLTPTDDYTPAVNRVTLKTGAAAGDIVQILVSTVPVVDLTWNTVRLDTSSWSGTSGLLKDFQGNTLTPGAVQDVMLSVDGVWQNPGVDYTLAASTLTFPQAIQVGARTFGFAVVPVQKTSPPVPGLIRLDTSGWAFNGTLTTFNLVDGNGVPVVPQTAVNVLISLNGVWQAAITDYTVSGSAVTFVNPPEANAVAFGIAGLPAFMTGG